MGKKEKSSIYIRKMREYVIEYNINSNKENWIVTNKNYIKMLGVQELFEKIYDLCKNKVELSLDIGAGPAAREVIRYNSWGWEAFGTDISVDVVKSANIEFNKVVDKEENKIILHDFLKEKFPWNKKFQFVSCLNVIQHFKSREHFSVMLDRINDIIVNKGFILLLYKRQDFNLLEACELGLQAESLDNDGLFRFYDKTFKEWREYRLFDSATISQELEKKGFNPFNNQLDLLQFYNSRVFPCSTMLWQKV